MSGPERRRSMGTTNMAEARKAADDLQVHGDPGRWVCVCKASSQSQAWMHSTKVFELSGERGCLVQTTSVDVNGSSQALVFVPGARLTDFME